MSESQTSELAQEQSNPIIEWANNRPHWEKYIWKLFLEQGGLTDAETNEAYRLFKITKGIEPEEELQEIDLSQLSPPTSSLETPLPLMSIKGIENVNALQDGTEIHFGHRLTVCYGANGSGKSGYGRLIGSACFTRGERVIHPNLKLDTVCTSPAKAEFVIGSDANQTTVPHVDGGSPNPLLKRFSMFDSHSAHIQLDNENVLPLVCLLKLL